MATLITFTAGTPILSADVNANFTAINTELARAEQGYVTTTTVGNVGTGEDTLASWVMPANTIVENSGLHVVGWVLFAGNANTKTCKFHVGGTALTLHSTTAPNNRLMLFDVWFYWYLNATNVRWAGTSILTGPLLDPTTPVIDRLIFANGNTGFDFTTATTLTVTGEGVATDDVQLGSLVIQAFRNP